LCRNREPSFSQKPSKYFSKLEVERERERAEVELGDVGGETEEKETGR